MIVVVLQLFTAHLAGMVARAESAAGSQREQEENELRATLLNVLHVVVFHGSWNDGRLEFHK